MKLGQSLGVLGQLPEHRLGPRYRAAQAGKPVGAAEGRDPQRDRVVQDDRRRRRRGRQPVQQQRSEHAALEHADGPGDRDHVREVPDLVPDHDCE